MTIWGHIGQALSWSDLLITVCPPSNVLFASVPIATARRATKRDHQALFLAYTPPFTVAKALRCYYFGLAACPPPADEG